MKLNISTVKSQKGVTETFEISESIRNISSKQYDVVFEGKVEVYGRVENADGLLYVEGRAQGIITLQCDRCLEFYQEPFDVQISNVIYPADKPVDDIDFYKTFSGNYLDMDELIQEAVMIGIPMTKVCSPECRGICEGCGKNLNYESCGCESDPYNPRMAALEDFFKDK